MEKSWHLNCHNLEIGLWAPQFRETESAVMVGPTSEMSLPSKATPVPRLSLFGYIYIFSVELIKLGSLEQLKTSTLW